MNEGYNVGKKEGRNFFLGCKGDGRLSGGFILYRVINRFGFFGREGFFDF